MLVADDGDRVTLDLHGYRVDEALRIVEKTLRIAHDRGRSMVAVIHGSSTTVEGARTIKSELKSAIDDGRFGTLVTYSLPGEDQTRLALPVGRATDSRRIVAFDVTT